MDREAARKKAARLVEQMTVEERASQLRYDAPAIKRLGIPAYNWWGEGLHGVARAGTATVFPQAIALAAMFDEEATRRIADAVASEGRAKYHEFSKEEDRDIYKGLTLWSPNVNIFRDPRWGRGHETFGEDPYLTSRLGISFVKGLQGEGRHLKTAACAKHFAVHSGPEALRHEFNAVTSEKDLRETYLPAFEACVKEGGVEAVMGAYNCYDGEPCCANTYLMQDILRGEWGFEGHFVSDCWAIRDFHENHMVTSTATESAALALTKGCDLNCGNTYLYILKAYEQGMVTEEQITEAAIRLFTTRYLLGMDEETEYDGIPYEVVECRQHRELAVEAARNSMVLLKNDGILPLDRNKKMKIGVIGPNADSRRALVGNYHGTSSHYTTILEGIRQAAPEGAGIFYGEGCHLFEDRTEHLAQPGDRLAEARIVARHSDVVVLCLGLDETLEGEEGDTGNSYASGDKEDLRLPAAQRQLMEEILSIGKPVIVCNMTGSAVDLQLAQEKANAVIQAWYPGAEGGTAFAQLLFGEYAPSGKLPVTFYRDLASLPAFEDYSMKGRTYRYLEEEPLYPFGFGLTYGSVALSEAEVKGKMAWVTAYNPGESVLQEVVQVYVDAVDSPNRVRNYSLCGFKRITLAAGEKRRIAIKLSEHTYQCVDAGGSYVENASRYELFIGTSQPDGRSRELGAGETLRVTVMRNDCCLMGQ